MGVPYETSPQSNGAWFREQIRSLRQGIDDATALARQAGSRGGTVMGAWTLAPYPVGAQGTQVLQRRGKLVTGLLRVVTTASIAQGGPIAVLPAGFRPDPAGNDVLQPGALASSTWGPLLYYISAADGVVRPLTGTVASGTTIWITLTPFTAGA